MRTHGNLSQWNDDRGFGFITVDYPSNGIQNGSPDGFALVDPGGTVLELLSYEGSFTAADGAAPVRLP